MSAFGVRQLEPPEIQGLSIEEIVDRALDRAHERWMRKGYLVSRALPVLASASLLLWVVVLVLVRGRGFEGAAPAAVHLACLDAVLTGLALGMVPRWRAYRFRIELEEAEPLEPHLAAVDEEARSEHG